MEKLAQRKFTFVVMSNRPSASACVPALEPCSNTMANGMGSRVSESTTTPLIVVGFTGACAYVREWGCAIVNITASRHTR